MRKRWRRRMTASERMTRMRMRMRRRDRYLRRRLCHRSKIAPCGLSIGRPELDSIRTLSELIESVLWPQFIRRFTCFSLPVFIPCPSLDPHLPIPPPSMLPCPPLVLSPPLPNPPRFLSLSSQTQPHSTNFLSSFHILLFSLFFDLPVSRSKFLSPRILECSSHFQCFLNYCTTT